MVSFNRCYNLLSVPQERILEHPIVEDSEKWITRGKIHFEDYSVKYRPDTEMVLKNINLKIEGGEKIGVVGRTGAGKSTL